MVPACFGGAAADDDEDEEDEEEEEEEEGGVDEAEEAEEAESIPEQETGEAREARLLSYKLQNRTDRRRERFEDIVARYQEREKRKQRLAKTSRQTLQERLEHFLGILPPKPPQPLHQRLQREEGACGAAATAPENMTAAHAITLLFDTRDRIVVSKESRVSLIDAVKHVRASQFIEVKLGTYRWSCALKVRHVELSGAREVSICGTCGAESALLPNGQRELLGPRLVGSWHIYPNAIGNITRATLFHNASSSTPGTATTRLPQRTGHEMARDRATERQIARRFAESEGGGGGGGHALGGWLEEEGAEGEDTRMALDSGDSGVGGLEEGGAVGRVGVVEGGEVGSGGGSSSGGAGGSRVFEITPEDVENFKEEGIEW